MTTMLESVTASLLGPEHHVLAKKDAEIVALKHALATSTISKHTIVQKLYSEATGTLLPAVADVDAMYERLVELLGNDDDEVWSTVQEYEVKIHYTVTVKATVSATSKDHASELAQSEYPSLAVESEGGMLQAYVAHFDITDVDVF